MKKIFVLLTAFLSLALFNVSFSQFPGCPDVDAGPDQTLTCNQACATITASSFQAGATTSYQVSSIPHEPPIAYDATGGTAISVNQDDVWSPIITLPFTFCFYGQNYTTCKVGSNGAIQFGPTSGGGSHPWSFSANAPSTALVSAGNVFGVYHDVDPTKGPNPGTVRYYILGEAPCRIFVVSFDNLAHFGSSCSAASFRSTHMMVLYETTNTIDVYVARKDLCTSWNGGRAIIGIQNPTGTQGVVAPGRNSTPTWSVPASAPEAWRFSPNGPSIITNFEWQVNGQFLSNQLSLQVCPSEVTTYKAVTTYTSCSGEIVVVEDDVTINPSPDAPVVTVVEAVIPSCGEENGSITVSASGGVPGYQYSIDGGANYQATGTFNGLASGTYNITVLDQNGCIGGVTVPIIEPDAVQISILNQTNVTCFGDSDGSIEVSVSGGNAPYTFSINGTSNGANTVFSNLAAGEYNITVTDNSGCTFQLSTTVTQPELIPATINYPSSPICSYENANPVISGVQGGTFTSTPAGLTIAASGNLAGVITGASSNPGTYTVIYTFTNPNGCEYQTETQVTVLPQPNISAGIDTLICDGDAFVFNATGGVSYVWQGGFTNGGSTTPPVGTHTYTVTGTDANGCQGISTVTVTVSPYPVVSFTSDPTEGYPTLIVTFENTSSEGTSDFVWNFGGEIVPTNSQIVTYPFEFPGTYDVVLSGNLNGCESTAYAQIVVFQFDPPEIVLPNVFSPNNDGSNDNWELIKLINARELNIVIVNRWGNVVFESNDLDASWNGKLPNGNDAAEGVYFYKYVILGWNGETYEGHGNITLIRE